MNILIKLTCLIGLVIAPILGNGSSHEAPKVMMIKMESPEGKMMGKCDMTKCATMTKDECASMCDSLECTGDEKEMCLSHFDKDGKFVASKSVMKTVNVQISDENGKAKATVITNDNGNKNIQVFEGSLEEVKAQVEKMK
jgi:K(+)-stimulated pyrophosphate-energized sodium pump